MISCISQLIIVVWPLLLLMGLVYLFKLLIKSKSSSWRGYQGEQIVLKELSKLNPEFYITAYDIMLPSDGNSTYTQIDTIVISNCGVFCIEVKAHRGWIFGFANRKTWKQTIYKHKKYFYNPLFQNYAHMKAIKTLLKIELKAPIIPLVVFPYAEKLKITGSDNVVDDYDLIEKIIEKKELIYSNEERDRIYHLLMNNNIVDNELREQHIREIKNLKK